MKPASPPFLRLEYTVEGFGFDFEVPASFFEKASAGPAKMRRIGGIISTESPDRQSEVILQRGLDFSDYLKNGWMNDNHSHETDGILGYPEMVRQFQKGQTLPDGNKAKTNLTWSEGYLLPTKKADRIWELGLALQGTGRALGFSVEGSIQKRIGRGNKTIAKALVRNVAITNCPVNSDSRLDILTKSLYAVQNSSDALFKALGVGTGSAPPLVHPAGPQTGPTAGQVLTTESLEDDEYPVLDFGQAKKSLSDAEAFAWVLNHRPDFGLAEAGRFIELTKALKRGGRL